MATKKKETGTYLTGSASYQEQQERNIARQQQQEAQQKQAAKKTTVQQGLSILNDLPSTSKKNTATTTSTPSQWTGASANNAKVTGAQMEADYLAGNLTGNSNNKVDTSIQSNIADYGKGSYGTPFIRNENLTGYGSMNGVYYEFYDDGTAKYFDEATGKEITDKYVKNGSSNGTSSNSPSVTAAESYLDTASKSASKNSISDDVLDILYQFKNRPSFSYDPTQDTLYQNALTQAMKGGQMAMQDTLGQASALTGGYGSSYATSAANQAYNQFIDSAYDSMADYYNMALNAYNAEGQRLLDAYSMLSDQQKFAYEQDKDKYDREWQEKRAARADYESDRAFEYQQGRDAIGDEQWWAQFNEGVRLNDIGNDQWERSFEYGKDQDEIHNQQTWAQIEEEQEQNDIKNEQWQKGYDFDVSQAEITNQLNRDKFEHDVAQDAISNNLAQQRINASKRTSGGGDETSDTSDKPADKTTDTFDSGRPTKSHYTQAKLVTMRNELIDLASTDPDAAVALLEKWDAAAPFTDDEWYGTDSMKGMYELIYENAPDEETRERMYSRGTPIINLKERLTKN